jgi:hypothetical protein
LLRFPKTDWHDHIPESHLDLLDGPVASLATIGSDGFPHERRVGSSTTGIMELRPIADS